jgi:serine/threonine protein kinase
MELAQYSLEQLIKIKKFIGSSYSILQQTAGLIRILFILQQENIAHRDIKPANILVF